VLVVEHDPQVIEIADHVVEVGPRAGETLGELTLAVRRRLTAGDVAGTTHAYPTYDDAVWNAAVAEVRRRLGRPVAAAAVRAGRTARRVWLDRRH
jgi:excinuclease UvrABC ATPase subunit